MIFYQVWALLFEMLIFWTGMWKSISPETFLFIQTFLFVRIFCYHTFHVCIFYKELYPNVSKESDYLHILLNGICNILFINSSKCYYTANENSGLKKCQRTERQKEAKPLMSIIPGGYGIWPTFLVARLAGSEAVFGIQPWKV